MKIAILHHDDADGFGSAFAAWKALNDTHELLFKPVQYGEPIPYAELREFGPEQVYILDFSCKAPDLREMMNEFHVAVIDHHKSAAEDLVGFPEIELAQRSTDDQHLIFSGVRIFQENSGCVLSWLFFNPNDEIPEILAYVEDRDLWQFGLEHSKEINAYIATMPFDFAAWDDFYLPLAYDAGKAILNFQARQIESRVKAAELVNFATFKDEWDFRVPCVNATENISELGDALGVAFPEAPFTMSYCDRPDGLRSYSLRSRTGFDVSEVARAFNGGGHKGAAGFTLPSPAIFN